MRRIIPPHTRRARTSHTLLPRHPLHLLRLLPIRIPLPGLQHQHTHQDQRQNRITRRQHPQTILPPNDLPFPLGHPTPHRLLPLDQLLQAVRAGLHDAQALDDVGDVDDDAADVQDQAGAVEQHVGLRGPVELKDKAEQADGDDDVQDARDQGRRGVQEAEVRFQLAEVGFWRGEGGPEDGVVVGEEREEDAEEEGGCWVGDGWG